MFILLFIAWLIFNGKLTLEIVLVGLAVTALVYAFTIKFLNWSVKKDLIVLKFVWFLLSYLVILIVEIVKATLATIGMTFSAKEEICPVVVEFKTDIKNVIFRVVLANSITMTPGTITESLEDGTFIVHALDESFAVDIDKSIFVERLLKADELLERFKER